MAQRIIKIPVGDSIVSLITEDGDGVFNADDILRIDYANIVGELLTFPVIVNRIGILRAQAEDEERRVKLQCDIYRADLAERLRKDMAKMQTMTGGVKKLKPPTKDEVDNSVISDDGYRLKMGELHRAQRNFGYIDSFYWAVKSKDTKLKAIAPHVPMDFEQELVETTINGMKIKKTMKPFRAKQD